MKIIIHRQNHDGTFADIEHLVERDKLDEFIEKNIQPNEYFTVGNMYPDGWYEREYRKAYAV